MVYVIIMKRIIKIGFKSDKGIDIVDKLKNKFKIGDIGDISEFNKDLCNMYLISVLEDHLEYAGEIDDYLLNIPKNFENISLLDSSIYNLFTYFGNSKIDDCPIFSVSYTTWLVNNRNFILEQLGI